MSDTKPQQNILSSSIEAETFAAANAAPLAEPPEGLASISLMRAAAGAEADVAKSFTASAAASATVWVNGKKINALWSINENRNSWVGVTGVGWVKLANNNDTAIVALTMLGADAKITQGTVNYRQESDGMIHEMYVW